MRWSHHIHVFFIEIRKCFTIWSASILVLHDVGKWNRFSWTRNVVLSFPLCRLLRYHHQHHFSGSCPPLEVMVQVDQEVSLLHLNHVFQWDRECFIILFVNILSRFFTMSVDEISTHGSRIFDVTFLSLSSILFTHAPCRTHIFFALFPYVTCRHEHVWLKEFAAHMSHLILFLFPHGHFDISFPSTSSLPSCSRSESAGQAQLCRSGENFGHLTDPTHSTN